MTIKQSQQKYLRTLAGRLSDKTVMAYSYGLDVFNRYLQDEYGIEPSSPIGNLRADHFILFPSWALAEVSPVTKKRYSKMTLGVFAAAVKSFLEDLVIAGHILPTYQENLRTVKAFERIARKKEHKEPKRTYHENILKMREAVHAENTSLEYGMSEKSRKAIWLRDIALIECLITTGCRNEELTRLTLANFDMEHGIVRVIGKGNKERDVALMKHTREALQEYWAYVGISKPSEPAFCRQDKGATERSPVTTATVRNVVHRVELHAGLEHMHPHYFRHEFARELRRKGYDLTVIRDALGHANTVVTERYSVPDADEVMNAARDTFG